MESLFIREQFETHKKIELSMERPLLSGISAHRPSNMHSWETMCTKEGYTFQSISDEFF